MTVTLRYFERRTSKVVNVTDIGYSQLADYIAASHFVPHNFSLLVAFDMHNFTCDIAQTVYPGLLLLLCLFYYRLSCRLAAVMQTAWAAKKCTVKSCPLRHDDEKFSKQIIFAPGTYVPYTPQWWEMVSHYEFLESQLGHILSLRCSKNCARAHKSNLIHNG